MKKLYINLGIPVAIFLVTGIAVGADVVRDYFAAEATFQSAETQFLKANASREDALRRVDRVNQMTAASSGAADALRTAIANEKKEAEKALQESQLQMDKFAKEKEEKKKELERLKAEILKQDSSTVDRLEKKIDTLLKKVEALEKRAYGS